MRLDRNFNFNELEPRIARARGRAVIAVGEGVSSHAKKFVDVVSGDLMRSIHMAAPDSSGTVKPTQHNVQRGDSGLVEVGSWLNYACVEETGRMHQFMAPAIDAVRPQVFRTVKQAFREEGFS